METSTLTSTRSTPTPVPWSLPTRTHQLTENGPVIKREPTPIQTALESVERPLSCGVGLERGGSDKMRERVLERAESVQQGGGARSYRRAKRPNKFYERKTSTSLLQVAYNFSLQ